jgi:cytoskeletal protein RodZ
MNKLYRLPLRMKSKTQLSDARRRRKSPNLVVAGILVVGGLFALIAICLTVFGAFGHKADVPKEVGVPPVSANADTSPGPPGKENESVMPLANPNPTTSAPVVSSRPANDQQSPAPESNATPASSPTPASNKTASAGQKQEQKAEAETRSPDKPLTKSARQNLEKKRKEAERKRAFLEQKYQNHEISAEVYNKSKEEYKNEIQKYRNELKSAN